MDGESQTEAQHSDNNMEEIEKQNETQTEKQSEAEHSEMHMIRSGARSRLRDRVCRPRSRQTSSRQQKGMRIR